MNEYLCLLADLDQETLRRIALRTKELGDSFWVMLQVVLVVVLFGFVIHKIFKKKLNKPPVYDPKPLEYKKIVFNQGNARKKVRIPLKREIIFDQIRFAQRRLSLSSSGQTMNISQKGLSFVSTLKFQSGADITFKIRETQLAMSPSMMGIVVSCGLWRDPQGKNQLPGQPPYYLTCLDLKNLSQEAKLFVSKLVVESERKMLTRLHQQKEHAKQMVLKNNSKLSESRENSLKG